MWGRKATVLSHKYREQRLDKLSVFFLSRYLLEKRASISSPPLRPHTPVPKSAGGGAIMKDAAPQTLASEYARGGALQRPLVATSDGIAHPHLVLLFFFSCLSSVCFAADVYTHGCVFVFLYGFVCFVVVLSREFWFCFVVVLFVMQITIRIVACLVCLSCSLSCVSIS